MASKEVTSKFVIHIPAQSATPAPPVGSALGQKGVNIKEFCDKFNAASGNIERGMKVAAKVTLYKDKSFDMVVSAPLTSVLLKKYANLKKGASAPGREVAGKISKSKIEEIAQIKLQDLGVSLQSAINTISGSARAMGLEVID